MDWLTAITENVFYEVAVILFLAALPGALGQFLRQPLIVMFIAPGIFVGPSVPDDHKEIKYLGIDFDPTVVKSWQEKGKDIIYGDIEDPDLLERLPIRDVKCIISTIPDLDHSRHLVRSLRKGKYDGSTFLTALNEKDFKLLDTCGADQVLMPQRMAAINFYNSYLKGLISQQKPV